MKKYFTILWVFIGFVNLQAQVPAAVFGDVYVAGPVYSKGQFHVSAEKGQPSSSDTLHGSVRIASSGSLYAKSIVLHSNNYRDGLLLNEGIVDTPDTVIVRKFFDDIRTGWQHVSFPFDVSAKDIKNPLSGQPAYGNGVTVPDLLLYVYFFNARHRADYGLTGANNWTPIDSAYYFNLPKDTLQKGIGYQLWGDVELDFETTNRNQIDSLFNPKISKTNELVYFQGEHSTKYGSGWNLIGGLNSANFIANSNSIAFNAALDSTQLHPDSLVYNNNHVGAIYYWDYAGDHSHFSEYPLDPAISLPYDLNIPPYVPFFVQTNLDTVSLAPIDFTFKGGINYNTLTSARPATSSYTRSSTDQDSEIRDVFSLSLNAGSGIEVEKNLDQLYLMFGNMYHDEFVPVEDGLKMTTESSSVARVWSTYEDGTALFMNRLPRRDQTREVKIGFSVPVAGEYTFNLSDIQNTTVRTAVLLDNLTNKSVDLLQYPYTFYTTAVASRVDDRFVLFVNGTVTDIDKIAKSEVYAYASDNVLAIRNILPGCDIQVSDLSGRTIVRAVATSDKFSTALNQKGVYIVSVKGEKNAVLKILNK